MTFKEEVGQEQGIASEASAPDAGIIFKSLKSFLDHFFLIQIYN